MTATAPPAYSTTANLNVLRVAFGTPAGRGTAYRIAAGVVDSDVPLPALDPFAQTPPHATQRRSLQRRVRAPEVLVYRGEALVGGRIVEVACARAGSVRVLRVAGAPALLVQRGGCAVIQYGTAGADAQALSDALLGPGLILALALNGVFTLHAAAVSVRGEAMLFLGESGAGKSTLARALVEFGAVRLADDVLPCRVDRSGLVALPHYPQLKLAAAEQYGVSRPSSVPVRAVYLLAGSADAPDQVTIAALGEQESAITAAAHTVAARLFDASLLAPHLSFCAAAAAAVRVRSLRFRKRPESLPGLVAAVRDNLESLG